MPLPSERRTNQAIGGYRRPHQMLSTTLCHLCMTYLRTYLLPLGCSMTRYYIFTMPSQQYCNLFSVYILEYFLSQYAHFTGLDVFMVNKGIITYEICKYPVTCHPFQYTINGSGWRGKWGKEEGKADFT